MKIIIFIGMTIIFISVFFTLFIFDSVISGQLRCIVGFEENTCNLKQTGTSLIVGLSLIVLFLLVDSAVLYLIIKAITSSGSSYIAYSI